MAKKIEINENWEPVEVEDLDNLFVVIFKQGSFDQGYVEAFDTDDVLMQSAYDSLAKQYSDCGCDELTKIYLIKVPNTEQTVNMCNTGLFNGNCCDPHVIEAARDLFNRADCEQLSCWEGCGLTEAKKKKKPYSSAYCGLTDPVLNIKHFNKCMGTGGLQNNDGNKALIIGDVLPNGPVADAGSSDGASDAGSSAGEGGAMGESLNEGSEEYLNNTIANFNKAIEAAKADNKPQKYIDTLIEYRDSLVKILNNKNLQEDVTKELKIQDNENIEKDIEDLEPPIDPEYFPNNMGINLSSVKKEIWVQQDDGQLKSIEVEFDPATEEEKEEQGIEESLTEDLIVIEQNEAKEKLTELRNQIESEENENIRKSLLTLMSIYLYQTFKPSDRENSTITDAEWQEIADWHTAELKKDKQELTEAHLDYSAQLAKMKALEAGTRGFNAGSASLEKILFNYDICISHNLPKARKAMEDALRLHGWDRYIKPSKIRINFPKIELNDFTVEDAEFVYTNLDNIDEITDYAWANVQQPEDSYKLLVVNILYAILFKRADVANNIRDYIINNFENVSAGFLKQVITEILADANLKQRLANCVSSVLTKVESLDEEVGYSHRKEDVFNIPPQIKILDQEKVEEFITKLSPEELFYVGYVTPIHFYAELEKLFELVKATQFVGYTGLDYRDAVADQNVADHADRVANAQRQIDTYKTGAKGHQLNKEGEKFSTSYRATNKLALNAKKDNELVDYEVELDDNGNVKLDDKGNTVYKTDAEGKPIIKSKIDLNKLLFYPEVGSHPLVTYFLDVKDGKGFRKVSREFLTDILYEKVIELADYADRGFSEADLRFLKKQKLTVDQYVAQFGSMPVSAYKKALEQGIDPKEYRKLHPYSSRWSSQDFRLKVDKMLDQDEKTIEAVGLDAAKGMDRNVVNYEAKPQVRALYTNQIYYLRSKNETLGSKITEGLEEDVELDEAKRYVKRYYVRPLNIFCGNKEDIIQALIRAGDQNCSVYSLKNLTDHEDVHLLQPSDIIYYWDDRVLYDKNHVQVMDYDLFVKHEEERKKVGNVDTMSDAAFGDMYDDRATEDDLKDKDVIANYKALNKITR